MSDHFVGLAFKGLSVANPIRATGLFLYPLKTSENPLFSDVFRAYGKGLKAWYGLTLKTSSVIAFTTLYY